MAFDPSMLQPAGQPTPIPPEMLGMTQDQYQDIPANQRPMQQVMQTPDGKQMFKRSGPDGTYYETPRVGESAIRFREGANGWEPEQLSQGGWSQLGKNAYQDPRFMSFLAVAAGGAIAASYAGAGAAGGAGSGAAGGVGTANMSAGQLAAMDAAGGGMAGTGLGGGAAAAGGTAAAGAATGLGGGSSAGLGGAAGTTAAGGGLLSQAGNFLSNNPGLVGAGLGAIAGAVSGNVDMTTNASRGLADYALPAGQAYAGMAQNTINGQYLGQGLGTNPYAGANPFLDKAMGDVAGRMTDAYKNGTAAQSMGQFQQGGAFGGSAHQQFMEGQNRAFADSLGSTMNNMSMQDYTTQQGLAENSLNRQLSQFQGERNNMMGAAGGLAQLGGTATQTQEGVGPWQGAIGGGLAGWGMGMQSQQQPTGYGLGGQPITTGVQMPQNAVKYQPTVPNLNTRLYAS